MMRLKPITDGMWAKIARKHYLHASGIVVRYNCNRWVWEIIGGPEDGLAYVTLTIAQYSATRHFGKEAA